MSPGNDPIDDLTESCRRAFEHLEDRRPEAEVVAVHGDWAYVSVGHIDVAGTNDLFEEDEALGIVRIPHDFPSNTDPYGFVTVPFLERTDGESVEQQDRNHNHAQPVEEALGVEDLGFWSWNWNDVSSSEESDLRKAPDMIRERLQMED